MKKVLSNEELSAVSGGLQRNMASFALCFSASATTTKVPEAYTFTISTRK